MKKVNQTVNAQLLTQKAAAFFAHKSSHFFRPAPAAGKLWRKPQPVRTARFLVFAAWFYFVNG